MRFIIFVPNFLGDRNFDQDETFDNYRATVAGFGNMLLITPLVPEGKLIVTFLKSYQLNG